MKPKRGSGKGTMFHMEHDTYDTGRVTACERPHRRNGRELGQRRWIQDQNLCVLLSSSPSRTVNGEYGGRNFMHYKQASAEWFKVHSSAFRLAAWRCMFRPPRTDTGCYRVHRTTLLTH